MNQTQSPTPSPSDPASRELVAGTGQDSAKPSGPPVVAVNAVPGKVPPAPVRFRRAKAWIGRAALAVCAPEPQGCRDPSCRMKPFCKCAKEEIRTLGGVEMWVWMLVVACAAAVILCWKL